MEEKPKLSKKFIEKTLIYFLAGLGFVAALAWNDAVQALFGEVLGASQSTLVAKFGYAIVVTLVLTLVSWKIGGKT